MSAHRCQPPAAFRVFAAVWLLVWLAAQTLCVHHCMASVPAADHGSKCCSKKAASSGESPVESGSSACGGLKAVQYDTKSGPDGAPIAAPPAVSVLFVLPRPAETVSFIATGRSEPRTDFVFLPEESLGAALRSTAPPARS